MLPSMVRQRFQASVEALRRTRAASASTRSHSQPIRSSLSSHAFRAGTEWGSRKTRGTTALVSKNAFTSRAPVSFDRQSPRLHAGPRPIPVPPKRLSDEPAERNQFLSRRSSIREGKHQSNCQAVARQGLPESRTRPSDPARALRGSSGPAQPSSGNAQDWF